MYLTKFTFPDADQEFDYLLTIKRKCYTSFYPFQILGKKELPPLIFAPITILYGSNGSGKTTALNIMAEALQVERDTLFNRTNFFQEYVRLCTYETKKVPAADRRIITSDDVFDYMLNARMLNDGISVRREELFTDYLDAKYAQFQMKSLADYERLKKVNLARSQTQSKYVRHKLMACIREQSNGESAFWYFSEKIKEQGLYLLDEPENSLAPQKQLELVQYLEDSARFFGCQFVIATHSPFILSLRGAKIYDLDAQPVTDRRWTELGSVRVYYEFFKKHAPEFK